MFDESLREIVGSLFLLANTTFLCYDEEKMDWNDLVKLKTSLCDVMGYIKYSKNSEQLKAFLASNSQKMIDRNAAQVIKTITKTPIEIPEGVEVFNMCEAIEKMMADSEEKGMEKGVAKGKVEGRLGAFSDLVKDGLLSVKEAAARLNMTEAEFEAAMKR